jgi:hypothetical protein
MNSKAASTPPENCNTTIGERLRESADLVGDSGGNIFDGEHRFRELFRRLL